MDFELFRLIHSRSLKVILMTGEEYHGLISSHSFNLEKMKVEEFSLMNDKGIVRVKSDKIKSIIDLDSKQEYHLSP